MTETTCLAMIFALLAFVGGTAGEARVGKMCPTGLIAQIAPDC